MFSPDVNSNSIAMFSGDENCFQLNGCNVQRAVTLVAAFGLDHGHKTAFVCGKIG
jgi:hypothetical protein